MKGLNCPFFYANNTPMFLANNFIAIDKSTIPNTLLNTSIPPSPNNFSILGIKRITTKINTKLIKMLMIILINEYSDLRESKVVNVPAPAITGKAKGTIVEVFASL